MYYFIVFGLLLILQLIYFRIADRFNIIDKPNERSSHSNITLRGGGIIFYLSALLFFLLNGFPFPWFFLGLTLMTLISFLDDIFTLSNKIRLIIHFGSVLLMSYELQIFSYPWYYLIICFIIIVGVINAYNFMDGINGITVSYSLSILVLLLWVNSKISYINGDFIIYVILGVLVFGIFNFRMKAKSFAGDVGSVSIAYIILFFLGMLIVTTGEWIYILFLSIYGIDAVWTIINRILKRENIFKAHRSHLYQYLANEAKVNKLIVSASYGILQFLVGISVINVIEKDLTFKIVFTVVVLSILSIIYLAIKSFLYKKYISI